MTRRNIGQLNFSGSLTIIFALLAACILGGNGLLIWQFRLARQDTNRVGLLSRQMTAILRLQNTLVSYHHRLDQLIADRDASALTRESAVLQAGLLEQIQNTRAAIGASPQDESLQAEFLPLLDAIEIGLPHQLESINSVAAAGDWDAVANRVELRLKPTETEVTAFANSIDKAFTAEIGQLQRNALQLQSRILFFMPILALLTFLLAALFVWVSAQRTIELRLEERLDERMRITRDLHDTFLQTVQASRLLVESILPESKKTGIGSELTKLAGWLERAIREGRAALNTLRATPDPRLDLADILRAFTSDAGHPGSTEVRFSVTGTAIGLLPEMQDEIVRIAREAITNALKHSRGHQVVVKLAYAGFLSLIVSDDGTGFPAVTSAPPEAGHYGLRIMRERAARLGADLTITSSLGTGTEVKLVLPRRTLRRRLAES
jgi:signal transduction histidine kinase